MSPSPDPYRTPPEKIADELREEKEKRREARSTLLAFAYGGFLVVAAGASVDVAIRVGFLPIALYALAGVSGLFGATLIVGGIASVADAGKRVGEREQIVAWLRKQSPKKGDAPPDPATLANLVDSGAWRDR